jgi:aryl-alcohol dehydrogenase-like predicted oxidoreductase
MRRVKLGKTNIKVSRLGTGCIEINYGHESGSLEILKYYQNGISVGKKYLRYYT